MSKAELVMVRYVDATGIVLRRERRKSFTTAKQAMNFFTKNNMAVRFTKAGIVLWNGKNSKYLKILDTEKVFDNWDRKQYVISEVSTLEEMV